MILHSPPVSKRQLTFQSQTSIGNASPKSSPCTPQTYKDGLGSEYAIFYKLFGLLAMRFLKKPKLVGDLLDEVWIYFIVSTIIMYTFDLDDGMVTALKQRGMIYLMDQFQLVSWFIFIRLCCILSSSIIYYIPFYYAELFLTYLSLLFHHSTFIISLLPINSYILMKYKKYILKSYPSILFPQDLSCFQFVHNAEVDENSIPEGFVLIKTCWVSLDPLLRTWISGAKSYLDPVKPGSGIPGFGIAKVVKANIGKGSKIRMQQGDWVIGMLQWSQYILIECSKIHKLPIDLQTEQYKFLTVYGPTGFTSFYSIKMEILPFQMWDKSKGRCKTKEQLNIVISSAAGGVGLTVIQYLYQFGYRNIYGIAGTDEKCQIAKKYGCKNAINYKKYYTSNSIDHKRFEADTKKMLEGEQIDIYYENVGEDMLSSMLKLMADHSKIIMCGALATYNNWNNKSGVLNFQQIIFKRVQMKGILYYGMQFNERVKSLIEMIGFEMKGAEVIIEGIQKLPQVYRDMIDGKYIGKPVVRFVE